SHLNADSAVLAEGSEAVCIFVNDEADAAAIARLADLGVRLIALRCAGFNNVDLRAAARFAIPVVRVPAYSPHCRGRACRGAAAGPQSQDPPCLLADA
ncbi:D-isomer specific 2-hydroxyacid dehydrogenase, NAD-binding protein, partial [human gut metagenome]